MPSSSPRPYNIPPLFCNKTKNLATPLYCPLKVKTPLAFWIVICPPCIVIVAFLRIESTRDSIAISSGGHAIIVLPRSVI